LRRFVNVYVNDEDVRFMGGLGTALKDGDTVTVLPAVAGGAGEGRAGGASGLVAAGGAGEGRAGGASGLVAAGGVGEGRAGGASVWQYRNLVGDGGQATGLSARVRDA